MSEEFSKHVRGQIRAAVAEALKGIPATGGRVFQARAWPLQDEDLPCWLVHIEGEKVDTKQTGRARIQSREITISAVALVKHADDVEDQMDDLTAVAEETIFSDAAVQLLTRDFVLTGTESVLNADGAMVIGQTRLAFTATIPALEGHPRNRA